MEHSLKTRFKINICLPINRMTEKLLHTYLCQHHISDTKNMKNTNNQFNKVIFRILIILQIAQLLTERIWPFILSIANYLAD